MTKQESDKPFFKCYKNSENPKLREKSRIISECLHHAEYTEDEYYRLIYQYPTFSYLFSQNIDRVQFESQVGMKMLELLYVVNDIRRIMHTDVGPTKVCFETNCDVAKYCYKNLFDNVFEKALVFFIGEDRRLIESTLLSSQEYNSIELNIESVIRALPSIKNACVYIAHNHPSGAVIPSESDLRCIDSLRELFENKGAQFADSVIVGGDRIHFICANETYEVCNKEEDGTKGVTRDIILMRGK